MFVLQFTNAILMFKTFLNRKLKEYRKSHDIVPLEL